jgi:hypothetical protein
MDLSVMSKNARLMAETEYNWANTARKIREGLNEAFDGMR